jgi:hypothetical protein
MRPARGHGVARLEFPILTPKADGGAIKFENDQLPGCLVDFLPLPVAEMS